MPEVITKHPDVVKQVLESAGAKCGVGAPQKILEKCPREQFCSLPGGEICVYGVRGIAEMTQLSRAELCEARTESRPPVGDGVGAVAVGWSMAMVSPLIIAAVVLGRRRSPSPRHSP
jgi:hypothetical protein